MLRSLSRLWRLPVWSLGRGFSTLPINYAAFEKCGFLNPKPLTSGLNGNCKTILGSNVYSFNRITGNFSDPKNDNEWLTEDNDNTMYMDSVLRKRRLKMKKHKLKKRRKNQRALRKRLGKI